MEHILELADVSKAFPQSEFVLDRLSFSLPYGAVMGVVGENVPRYEQETGSLFRHLQLWRELYT